MTTQIFSFRRGRFSKIVVTSILTLGLALVSAQAALSDRQAKDAANAILQGDLSTIQNRAVEIAQSVTQGTDPADAAANVEKIVSFLPNKAQRQIAGRIGIGVALNFPNQLPGIVMKLMTENSNLRKHGSLFIAQMSAAAGFDQAEQIAAGLALAMRKTEGLSKQAPKFVDCILAGIVNRPGISAEERAIEMARVAANLSAGVIGNSKNLSSYQIRQLKTIARSFSSNLKTVAGGDSNLVYQAVGNFVNTMKNAVSDKIPSSKIIRDVLRSTNEMQGQMPGLGAILGQAISDALSAHGGTINTGSVNNKETPYVDENYHPSNT